jgi:hypothetical protein
LDRCWRHTLQAKPQRRGKTLTPPHLQPHRASPLHVKWKNQEGPWATSHRPPAPSSLCPDGLGRCGQGELSGTAVLPQRTLGQSSIAPWTDRTPPGEKRETE